MLTTERRITRITSTGGIDRTRRHDMAGVDDDILLSWARDGDAAAFAELYGRNRPAVLNYASSLCRRHSMSSDQAEDIVAEATRKVLQAIGNGCGPTSGFRQYLFSAARSVVYSQSSLPTTAQITEETGPYVDGPEKLIDGWSVLDALAQLPPRWQRILWSTGVEGYQPRDLAPQLGVSANNVAVLTHRAREGLRRALIKLA